MLSFITYWMNWLLIQRQNPKEHQLITERSKFHDNSAGDSGKGGEVACAGITHFSINTSFFSNNMAIKAGGAIYVMNLVSFKATACKFINNTVYLEIFARLQFSHHSRSNFYAKMKCSNFASHREPWLYRQIHLLSLTHFSLICCNWNFKIK